MPTGRPAVSPHGWAAVGALQPHEVHVPDTAAATTREARWLSLGPASRLLGIDPDSRRGVGRPLASMGASPERLNRVYRRHYAADAATGPTAMSPRDDIEREAYRQDGRRLITVLTAFLDSDATNAAERDRLEREASAIVDDQAARLAAAGSSLTEAVGRFVAARGPFLAE